MARRFCLAYVILSSFLVAGKSPKYALKGQEVKLTADMRLTGHPDEILWKHNGNKVVEFNGNQERVSNPFKNRIILDWHSAQLDIADLRFEDGGEYELEVFLNKKFYHSFSQLEVLEEVTLPTISCEMNDGISYNVSATLACSVAPRRQSVLFKWSSRETVQSGPTLTIYLGDTLDDEEYTCSVSNPLSAEAATFMAKDCYDKSSSVALIASTVVIAVVVLLVLLAIVFCKVRHKACFVEAKRNDLEEAAEDGRRTLADESTTLLARAPTLPSTQRLDHQGYLNTVKGLEKTEDKHETASSPPSTPHSESPSDLDPSDHDNNNNNNKGDAAEEDVPDPAVLADLSEGTVTDLESCTASKDPGSEEEADEVEEVVSPTANVVPPPAEPHSTQSQNPPDVTPEDPAGEHDKDSNSDQVNGGVATSVRESDSSDIGETDESDDSSEDEQSAAVPEQKGSETSLHDSQLSLGEALANDGNQQEMDRPVSAAENESDSVGQDEEFEEPNLYLADSQQLQSPTPTEHDNRNITTSEESVDTAHIDSEEEEEANTRNDSDEVSEDEGERAENKNMFQFGPKEDEPGQRGLNEDDEGHEENEVAARLSTSQEI